MRIGIDVGGTFTDVVLVDDQSGKLYHTKTPTTPKDLTVGVLRGIEKILEISSAEIENLKYIVHGTTIGTNALIERKGAKTGLITTEGFIDVLEIGRFQRPKEGLYDMTVDNPEPLVPRYLRKGVKERVNSKGEIVKPLDEKSAREAVEFLISEGVESIAVSFLFSFLNPTHERRVREIIKEINPEIYVSLSSDIAPEFREYERTSTTVLNAYLQPILERYLEDLQKKLEKKYGIEDLRIMLVHGGIMPAETAKKYAVAIVNSGPVGGVVAGSFIGNILGFENIITVDMGGTSFDISLIERGTPVVTTEGKFEGYPVKIPIVDVHTIGAGGGSIAWLDKAGVLNVGPQSAGADPGPACYAKGGENATVTDANLVLGRLSAENFLGGEMKLDESLARKVISKLANQMDMSVEEVAMGIIRVADAKMEKGIATCSTERGYDVREFALVAFGGAGPLHAVQIAMDLNIPWVVIPPLPSEYSAFGLLVADIKHDYVRSYIAEEDEVDLSLLQSYFAELEKRGIEQLRKEGVREEDMEIKWSMDMRYSGQSYELNIPIERGTKFTKESFKEIVKRFHKRHEEVYTYSSEDEKVEIVNLRVTAIGKVPKIQLEKIEKGNRSPPSKALKEEREVYFGNGFLRVPVYTRELMLAGNVVEGPCIIEEKFSTTVIHSGCKAKIDDFGNIIVEVKV
ncbi:hydantoinase/oxoprolinase family protein [Ferroglobus sp.]|uniref:hydantoinase/oxoprolinase family protein n=1 Tax=Ferroglobus sp. TaxID=2614230 RepID=UPI0025C5463B|nr:hydantoinase/oxoprolinase family protein [Ferroglobus sp.]